jgi:hypothetical protein
MVKSKVLPGAELRAIRAMSKKRDLDFMIVEISEGKGFSLNDCKEGSI